MVREGHLPQLPLMLAGVPRLIVSLLRAVGLPTIEFPKVSLAAAGLTQYVLFDSHSPSATARVRGVENQGVTAIDLRQLAKSVPEGLTIWTDPSSAVPDDERFDAAAQLLDALKLALEAAGGLWLRLGELPYPYRAVACLGVDVGASELNPAIEFAMRQSLPLTLFAAPVTRPVSLQPYLAFQAPGHGGLEWGWSLTRPGTGATARPASRWSIHAQRWKDAGCPIQGLLLSDQLAQQPSAELTQQLGFTYQLTSTMGCGSGRLECGRHPNRDPVRFLADQIERAIPATPVHSTRRDTSSWILPGEESSLMFRIDSAHVLRDEFRPPRTPAAPRPSPFQTAVGTSYWKEQYQRGMALMFVDPIDHLLAGSFDGIAALAAKCPLLWATTFGTLSRWLRQRAACQVQVWRRENRYELRSLTDLAPGLTAELWRGNHVALLPLESDQLDVEDQGLVYQSLPAASPFGMAIPRGPLAEPQFTGRSSVRSAAS